MIWLVPILAGVLGGWLLFDGTRALVIGDYVTARTGPHAGQLGPWANLVMMVGLPPRGLLLKLVHCGLGLLWLVTALSFAVHAPHARWGLVACAVLSLWYVPFGTIVGIAVMVLLLLLN